METKKEGRGGRRPGSGRPPGAPNKNPRPATEARQLTMSRELWQQVDAALEDRGLSRRELFEQAVMAWLEG